MSEPHSPPPRWTWQAWAIPFCAAMIGIVASIVQGHSGAISDNRRSIGALKSDVVHLAETCVRAEDLNTLCAQVSRLAENVRQLERLVDRIEEDFDRREDRISR